MDDATRASLRMTLAIAVSMLPRGVRHDLWRVCEPQHERAKTAVVEAMMKQIEFAFEVSAKPPREAVSFAYLYRGPGGR